MVPPHGPEDCGDGNVSAPGNLAQALLDLAEVGGRAVAPKQQMQHLLFRETAPVDPSRHFAKGETAASRLGVIIGVSVGAPLLVV